VPVPVPSSDMRLWMAMASECQSVSKPEYRRDCPLQAGVSAYLALTEAFGPVWRQHERSVFF
jgi:hypothetical protein